MFSSCARVFFQILTVFAKKSKKSKFPKMSDSVPSVFDVFPKMSEKSSRVPEWYTSGSWANAFDNTGWQKSPEYALIRIAAGAPDLAKSPNPPPDGPGRPRKSRHFSLRTEKLPDLAPGLAFAPQAEILSGAVFPDTRTDLRSVDLFPRRVEFCDRVRHILQMCAHDAKHSLKTAVRAQDILHTVHTVHNRNRHTCTNCAHRNTDVHTCAHRATTPNTSAENTSSMCCSCWEEGGAERPRAIIILNVISNYVQN